MKNIKLESLSIGIPFVNINFKIDNDQEKEIINEVLIRSEDKRFLTSWQCCSNCTENAIESVLDYRKLLVDQKVNISKIKKSQFIKVLSYILYILDEVKKFLSISERQDIIRDQRFLSEQLEILRNNILKALHKFCTDTKIKLPDNLFNMLKTKDL